ncbi:hypothetical protein ACP4OV_009114 [Aristida adscensionis]
MHGEFLHGRRAFFLLKVDGVCRASRSVFRRVRIGAPHPPRADEPLAGGGGLDGEHRRGRSTGYGTDIHACKKDVLRHELSFCDPCSHPVGVLKVMKQGLRDLLLDPAPASVDLDNGAEVQRITWRSRRDLCEPLLSLIHVLIQLFGVLKVMKQESRDFLGPAPASVASVKAEYGNGKLDNGAEFQRITWRPGMPMCKCPTYLVAMYVNSQPLLLTRRNNVNKNPIFQRRRIGSNKKIASARGGSGLELNL